jgi:hypothetical protein
MDLDIRLPIGLLFLMLGVILGVFGVAADPAIYEAHSLGLNINLWWGAVMALFGLVMLGLSVRKRRGLSAGDAPGERENTVH